jgi:hypothetical protein
MEPEAPAEPAPVTGPAHCGPPLSATGVSSAVASRVTHIINEYEAAHSPGEPIMSEDDVDFLFMYARAGNIDVAHLVFHGAYVLREGKAPPRGHSISTCYRRFDMILQRASRALFPLLDPEGEIITAALASKWCNTQDRLPGVKLLMDTVPLYVPNYGGAESYYNGKYQDHVCKLCPLVTVNGFFCAPTLGGYDKQVIFVGTSADSVIQDAIQVEALAEKLGVAGGKSFRATEVATLIACSI